MAATSQRFTDASVRNHPLTAPGAPRVELKDSEQKGLRLRIGARDKVFFWHGRVSGGGVVSVKLGAHPDINVKSARAAAADAQAKAASGSDPRAERVLRRNSLATEASGAELAQRFIKEHAAPHLRPRTIREYELVLGRDFVPRLGKKPISQITADDLRTVVSKVYERSRATGGTGIAANRFRAALSSMFGFAVAEGMLSTSPASGLRKLAKESARDRLLNDDEVKAVWQDKRPGRNQHMAQAVVRMLLLTVARRSEIASMRWKDVDQSRGLWTIPAHSAKNGKAHTVPLSATAQSILAEQRCMYPDSDFVFPSASHTGHIGADWITKLPAGMTRRNASLKPFTIHDLRRAAATRIGELTQNPALPGMLLNHSTRGVTGVYDLHSYDQVKRKALEEWDAWLSRLCR